MNKQTVLITFFSLFIAFSALSQTKKDYAVMKKMKSQNQLLSYVVDELKSNYGKKELQVLKKVKTKKEFVGYLAKKAKKCKECPVMVAFSTNLAVKDPSYPMSRKLTYGTYLTNEYTAYGDNEEGTDPDPDEEPDEDPDKDEDNEPDPEPDCEPFHCLSNWGRHIPCIGMPTY